MSKLNRYGEEISELRIWVPLKIIQLMDAEAYAKSANDGMAHGRTDVGVSILTKYYDPKVDEASVMLRLLGINPMVSEDAKKSHEVSK